MREVPTPNYEYEIEKLVRAYKRAVSDILRELDRLDLTDISRANAQAALAEVARILSSLNEESALWVAENIPKAALDGVAGTIFALGVADTLEEARTIAKFNRMNKAMVDAIIADTQSDLLAVTQNVERRVRAAVRQVTGESLRANMAKGINGRRTINRDTLEGLRKKLGDSVSTGIIDAAGRRWKPEVYVDMVTRTKMMAAKNEAVTNEALARNAYYAVISSHGAKDACRFHEGRIIKLSQDVPGNYPTYEQLRSSGQIWHPNCRHTLSPVRNPDRLPENVRRSSGLAEHPLPNYSTAILPKEKITGYALNKEHPSGKDKAVAFEKALGYTQENYRDLMQNVKANLPKFDAKVKPPNKFGERYEVVMDLVGPNGKTAKVLTGWIVEFGKVTPRLTTIHIDK